MKKKLVALMCALTMVTSFGCTVNASDDSAVTTTETETSDTQARIKEIKEEIAALEKELAELQGSGQQDGDTPEITVGETVMTSSYEFTLNKVEITSAVYPDDTSGYYNYYPADSGHVYLHIDADVKNTQKSDVICDEIYSAEADYNNGYTYQGFSIVEDTSLGFTYSNITQLSPLQTMGIHYLFDCPEEIGNSDAPLSIVITIENQKFKYTVR